MKLSKVTTKKKWHYHYDNIDELLFHMNTMQAANFKIEHIDEQKLICIYSQTIKEIKNN